MVCVNAIDDGYYGYMVFNIGESELSKLSEIIAILKTLDYASISYRIHTHTHTDN